MIKRLLVLVILAAFSLFSPGFAQSIPLYFAEYPALSPDGSMLVFSYAGDIWRVPSGGGTAERITGMQGIENCPRISPDGKWLAFSGSQYGNADVYIMPTGGGEIRQLTFHEAGDQVASWSWDSRFVYFTSNRYNTISTYKVNINGGTPQRIFGNYFNTIHDLVEDPATGEIFFNYSWESSLFATRKGYKGPFNPDIQSYNPATKVYKKYTDWTGKDFGTTIDRKGNIYFVSDEGNGQMNLYTFKAGKKTALTQFDEMMTHPFINADGNTIVFEKGYEIWMYDVANGKSHVIPITGFVNNTLSQQQEFNVKSNISSFDVSDDNKKLAFISRGRLFVSDIKGMFIRELNTLPMERVLEVHWLADNKTLIYGQTYMGYENWFIQPADGNGKEEQITSDSSNNRQLAFDSKKEKAVYLSGRNEVRLMDMKTKKSKTLLHDELWGFYNDQPYFSPDDRYITYTAIRNFEKDIFIYSIASGTTVDITNTGVTERAPFWSPDGKYLYFISDRTHPNYPYGSEASHIYRISLEKTDELFRSDKFDDLFKKEKKNEEADNKAKKDTTSKKKDKGEKKPAEVKKEDATPEKVKIDFSDMMARAELIGPRFGDQGDVYAVKDGDKSTILFTSNHDQGKPAIWKWQSEPFEEPKEEKFSGPQASGLNIAAAKDNYYILLGGDIYKLNIDGHSTTKIEMTDYLFHKNLKQEFDQMFYETWANLQENYYNETFNGVDWKSIRNQYAAYLPHLQSRANLRRLLRDMLGELNTSHYGFSSQGREESSFYDDVTAEPGITFDEVDPFKVKSVVKNGPADFEKKDIQPGDELIAVNDSLIDKQLSRAYYFSFPAMPKELQLTFKRGEKEIQVKVHPESYHALGDQLYDEWIADNARKVDQEGKKRIGYVYMKNMSMDALEKFEQDMVSDSCNRDALILDLRYNTGGNVHDQVLQFLSQRPYLQWKYREGKMSPQPDFAPAAKPIVLLVNEQTLSDGEMTAAGFQQLKLGTVIGTGTYRWIIFTTGKGLVDGSYYRLPSWGCYTLDGKNLERTGVTPDIEVANTFTDRLNGKDPQLDEAIKFLMDKLK